LFTFNDLWGYCLNVRGKEFGWRYGPLFKFCEPYPTREDAVIAAGNAIYKYLTTGNNHGRVDSKLKTWAKGLQAHQIQLL